MRNKYLTEKSEEARLLYKKKKKCLCFLIEKRLKMTYIMLLTQRHTKSKHVTLSL